MPVQMWRYYYNFMHHTHLESVLENGLLSLNQVRQRGISTVDISNPEVQTLRDQSCDTVYNRPLHDYVPLYINPRNPMLYVLRHRTEELIMLQVSPHVLAGREHVFTDGNAASSGTQFDRDPRIAVPSEQVLRAPQWFDQPDGKRRRCAEVLVHEVVEPRFLVGALCGDQELADTIRARVCCPFPVEYDPSVFFV